ncbi:RecQ family ATP-dependent DNA helicase [Rubrobacter tropicus]|uniref:ATP-dependent DNA helicase RecQ n=1 Tax=Rubrobacter tropicus TaxID=2653851 RepID=A0A6G8Q8F5_9ACTN|nr:ATP-dependent DNA helicase RecQ [Rubrobacter tropicus]QIN82751.1 RecQ family ATP-dependent DNA helicase [Rubrobacter tropicus]
MPQGILKEIFGFDSFRPGQEAVIRAVLEGRDTLAVMPTGGGKSLCYQIPALMQESLTVIVSPLISLMKDQVDSLLQSSVADAAALHSGLSPEERWEVERRVRTGEIRMLYVAPERLRSLEFVLSLRRAGVGLFVVDEAHCISEWGHDFRPDYLFLPRAVKDLGSPPVLALTATATPRVRQDIRRSLRMRDPHVEVTSFNRPNLTYRVVPAEKKEKLARILDVVRTSPPPGIVYATTRKECDELAAELRSAGVDAASYHAGLGAAKRNEVQERFMTDEVGVVVATIAFGMGVDKPNVRFVVHSSVPGSLPAYIQESGRAGRDGEDSECVVLFRGADVGRRKRLVTLNSSGEDEVSSFFRGLTGVERDGRANVPFNSLAALGGVEQEAAGIVLGSLENAGLVSRGYDVWAEVEVHRLDEEPGDLREEVAAVHAALPGAGSIGLPELSRKVGFRPAVVQGAVYRMMVDGVVEAVPRGSLVDVRLKVSSLDAESRRDIASRLKGRAQAAYAQIRDVESYATLNSCRREHLLRHFGDAEEVAPCSGCDFCLDEVSQPPKTPATVLAASSNGSNPDVDADLFERLRSWRGEKAREQKVPAYVVLHNSHLEEISARKPRTIQELGAVKGVGLRRAARYGEQLLALVNGEEPPVQPSEPPPTVTAATNGYRPHLLSATELLRSGKGAEAVPELARALELGGEEARRAVDDLLKPPS